MKGGCGLRPVREQPSAFCMSKFFNRKTEIDGIKFDSNKEANRYCELFLMQKAGLISDLRRQVRFELIPNQYMDGKLIERRVEYVADFVYRDKETDRTVVEEDGDLHP